MILKTTNVQPVGILDQMLIKKQSKNNNDVSQQLSFIQLIFYFYFQMNNNSNIPRSKLSNAAFIKWVRSRYNNKERRNNHYLYFPQELIQEMSIQKIFVEFDSDQSGGLSREQVFDMFNNFDIKITMEDLNELYDSVEINLEELDCEKFKKCALSVESNRVFRNIVAKLGQGYYPHNFTNMIIYIVFLSKREELRKQVGGQNTGISKKVEKMENLLKLNDLSLNNERLCSQTQQIKHNIKSTLRNIWEQTNEEWGNQFGFSSKLQEQFYQFCLHKVRD